MGTENLDARLDASIDGLFRRARLDSAPDLAAESASANVTWDERAATTLRAVEEAGAGDDAAFDTLLAPPTLEREPGEPEMERAPGAGAATAPTSRNGTQQMSDEMSSKPPPSRRPSLKELAESVKNRPSTPAPSSVSGVGGGARSSEGPPSSSSPASRHSLKDTLVALDGQLPSPQSARNAAPTSAQPSTPAALASRGAAPASAGATSTPVSAAPTSTPVVALAAAPPVSSPTGVPSTKPSPGVGKTAAKGGGAGIGIAIAVIGLAAAAGFGLWMSSKSQPSPTPTVAMVETAAPAPEPIHDAPKEAPEAEAAKPDGVLDLSQLDDAASAAPVGGPRVGGPLPAGSSAPVAVASAGPPSPGGPNEELGDAIRKRAGGGAGVGEDAEPAAAEGSKKNLPDIPPTGAVTSAVNAVKGSAKGCVSGADEPSSATITFSSSGAVQSVSVGGWASGKPAAGCIKSALQAAKVPAFARPSYSTSVTIRP